jgi:uncharacterized protein YecT (DUF1311 family)
MPPMTRLALALVLFPWPAMAQDDACATAITQQEMNACAYQEWEIADARLNDVYTAAMETVRQSDVLYPPEGDSEEDRLRTAQRAWVAFRDANCDAAGFAMRGGSAEPLLTYGCLRSMTEARISELQDIGQEF